MPDKDPLAIDLDQKLEMLRNTVQEQSCRITPQQLQQGKLIDRKQAYKDCLDEVWTKLV